MDTTAIQEKQNYLEKHLRMLVGLAQEQEMKLMTLENLPAEKIFEMQEKQVKIERAIVWLRGIKEAQSPSRILKLKP